MFWVIVAVIVLIIVFNIVRKKRAWDKEFQELQNLVEKAEKGDLKAQGELLQKYTEDVKTGSDYNIDYDLEKKYYWHWVVIYNGGNSHALQVMTSDINTNLQYVLNEPKNTAQYKASLRIIKAIQNGERKAYRHRSIYKERFPYDIGDTPDMIELHKSMNTWNY